MTTLMILGGSYLQVPLIRRAAARGFQVITADNAPGNPGHRFANRYLEISTVDVERIIDAARETGADAVMTACSDVSVPTVGAVNDALGWPGHTRAQGEIFCFKHRFRAFQRQAGLPHPAFVSGDDPERLSGELEALPEYVVVKAVDRSGSRGIRVVRRGDVPALRAAIDEAQRAGLSGVVCIEGKIDGVEYSGEAFVQHGRVAHLFVTDKYVQGTAVRGHSMPSTLPASTREAIRRTLDSHVAAIGYDIGPLNFDIILDGAGHPWVIEMSPRLGGNWIPQLIEFVFGVDLFNAAIDAAVRAPVRFPARPVVRPGGAYVLGARQAGRLVSRASEEEILKHLPDVETLELNVSEGAVLHPMRDSGDQIGRVLFELASPELYWERTAAIEAGVNEWLVIQPVENG